MLFIVLYAKFYLRNVEQAEDSMIINYNHLLSIAKCFMREPLNIYMARKNGYSLFNNVCMRACVWGCSCRNHLFILALFTWSDFNNLSIVPFILFFFLHFAVVRFSVARKFECVYFSSFYPFIMLYI